MTEATYRPVVGVHNAAKGCDQVFVRGGLIEGLAPALTVVAIDI